MKIAIAAVLFLSLSVRSVAQIDAPPAAQPAIPQKWVNGPPSTPSYFPIAVWLQQPRNAAKYKAIGVNLFVGLHRGPTKEQLDELQKAGMPVICSQTQFGLQNKGNRIIVGWMHQDEPDNAQSLGQGKGYGPPVPPQKIVADYQKIKAADPTRPVLLNLGQGVAWDGWYGRGVRTNKPEDYPQYARGADIVSFDIYPVTHPKPEISGNLWYVGYGVNRLRQWTNGQKPVWSCIEAAPIDSDKRPSPQQVRSEVWMAIIHGATGLIYFTHQFKPTFTDSYMLQDQELSKGIAAVNAQIEELAPVINSPSIPNAATVASSNSAVPIATMNKRQNGATYIFAVAMRDGQTSGTFSIRDSPAKGTAYVLGENRTIDVAGGKFQDNFSSYDAHIYRVVPAAAAP